MTPETRAKLQERLEQAAEALTTAGKSDAGRVTLESAATMHLILLLKEAASLDVEICPNCGRGVSCEFCYGRPLYDPAIGSDTLCGCGHVYYRHFDGYEQMKPVGCKYCGCSDFTPRQ